MFGDALWQTRPCDGSNVNEVEYSAELLSGIILREIRILPLQFFCLIQLLTCAISRHDNDFSAW